MNRNILTKYWRFKHKFKKVIIIDYQEIQIIINTDFSITAYIEIFRYKYEIHFKINNEILSYQNDKVYLMI
jgi:hypothetical protein